MRLAFLGIGNELNGDDAAGVQVVRSLHQYLDRRCAFTPDKLAREPYILRDGRLELLLLEGGAAPEAFTGPLRRFDPDWVILVDAASFDAEPGTVMWLDWTAADGMSASTHILPPTILSKYLINELGCRVALIGIQPLAVDFDTPMSHPVIQGVESAVDLLGETLVGP